MDIIKVDVTKLSYLIITYLQESCMGVEMHNDSKELVGGLHEVVIFASWLLKVIHLGSIYLCKDDMGTKLSQTTKTDLSIIVEFNTIYPYPIFDEGKVIR